MSPERGLGLIFLFICAISCLVIPASMITIKNWQNDNDKYANFIPIAVAVLFMPLLFGGLGVLLIVSKDDVHRESKRYPDMGRKSPI